MTEGQVIAASLPAHTDVCKFFNPMFASFLTGRLQVF
jgi:hypothetical protein